MPANQRKTALCLLTATAGRSTGRFRQEGNSGGLLRLAELELAGAQRALTVAEAALKGIFPSMHWFINARCCDNSLLPPPLCGPAPLSIAREKQVSQVGARLLSFANAGTATSSDASAARTVAMTKTLDLVTIGFSSRLWIKSSRCGLRKLTEPFGQIIV